MTIKALHFSKVDLVNVVFHEPVLSPKKYQYGSIDLVVTGPKLTTLFGGCKYGKITLDLSSNPDFQAFITALEDHLQGVKPEAEVTRIKDKIALKFPTKSVLIDTQSNAELDPTHLLRNTPMIPVISFAYYINGRKMALVPTLVKGLVYEREKVPMSSNEVDYEADIAD